MDKSRIEPTIFLIEKISFSLKLFSGHFYGQSFIKTVRGPLPDFSTINKLLRENIQTHSCQETKCQSYDVWYVKLPSGTLPSLLKLWLCGQNGLTLDVPEFTLTYKLKHTKSPGLKPLGLDP